VQNLGEIGVFRINKIVAFYCN